MDRARVCERGYSGATLRIHADNNDSAKIYVACSGTMRFGSHVCAGYVCIISVFCSLLNYIDYWSIHVFSLSVRPACFTSKQLAVLLVPMSMAQLATLHRGHLSVAHVNCMLTPKNSQQSMQSTG